MPTFITIEIESEYVDLCSIRILLLYKPSFNEINKLIAEFFYHQVK